MLNYNLQPLTKSILQVFLLGLLFYALYLIQGILVYGIIALYISILGRPVIGLLGKIPKIGHRLNMTIKASITLLLLASILFGISTWFFPVIIREFSFIGAIEYDSLLLSLQQEWSQLDALLSSFGINTESELEAINQTLQGFASVEAISSVLGGIAGSLGQFIVGIFSITFITFFLFREQDLANRFVDSLTPKKYHDKVDIIAPQIKRVITRYSFGILFQITAIFTLLAIGMSLIGVEGAIVLALCASVFNLIPYVGPIIGAALGILLGLGQLYAAGISDPSLTLDLLHSLYLLAGLFFVVQLLDNILFQPLIFSNSVGAHPLEIFLVISIAGSLLGVGGMIIAVPVYSIGRIIFNTALKTIDE